MQGEKNDKHLPNFLNDSGENCEELSPIAVN
jgi:hypothetical protein